jgi:4'-phosphopantetheinyl transferase
MASGALSAGRRPMLFYSKQDYSNIPEGNDWLHPAERAVADAFRFPKRRADWRLGRWTAKQAIASFLCVDPDSSRLASFEIRAAADGAPELFVNGSKEPVSISISHSEGTSFCVAGPPDCELGCDLEMIRPVSNSFIEDYFVAQEKEFLRDVPASEHDLFTLLIWSAKESALKSLREGLRRDTRSVVAVIEPGAATWQPLRVFCRETGRTFPGWWRVENDFVHTITTANKLGIFVNSSSF